MTERLWGFFIRKELKMAEQRRNPKGMVQSAVMVVNPVPPKKTNVARRGKRKPNHG